MQEKSHFGAIFLVDGGILAGGSAKCTPKRHERFLISHSLNDYFGTPQSRTAKRRGNGNTGCTGVTGRERRNTRREIAEH